MAVHVVKEAIERLVILNKATRQSIQAIASAKWKHRDDGGQLNEYLTQHAAKIRSGRPDNLDMKVERARR